MQDRVGGRGSKQWGERNKGGRSHGGVLAAQGGRWGRSYGLGVGVAVAEATMAGFGIVEVRQDR